MKVRTRTMKGKRKPGLEVGGFHRLVRIAVWCMIFLFLVAAGYYSGSSRAIEENEALLEKDMGKSIAPSNFSSLDQAPSQMLEKVPIEESGTDKREAFPLKKLPPGHLKRYLEAQEFISRIPAMEQILLERNPILRKALELEDKLEKEGRMDEGNKKNQYSSNDVGRRRDPREINLLKMDKYLSLLEDPDYALFIEDGLRNGSLAEDVPRIFAWRWEKSTGVDLNGVEFPETNNDDIRKFKQEFERFAKRIKSISIERGVASSNQNESSRSSEKYISNSIKSFILSYFKQSILPNEWVDEFSRNYESLVFLKTHYRSIPSPPKEVIEALEKMRSSSIANPQSIVQEI